MSDEPLSPEEFDSKIIAERMRDEYVSTLVDSVYNEHIDAFFTDIKALITHKIVTKEEALEGLSDIDDFIADNFEEWDSKDD